MLLLFKEEKMKKLYKAFIPFILGFSLTNTVYALEMTDKVVSHFKRVIHDCCRDAINIEGEYKNNGYYVNLKGNYIKDYSFNNIVIKFENLEKKVRDDFVTNGFNIDKLKKDCKVKFAGEITNEEIQSIIDREIARPATIRRIFSEAKVSCENDTVAFEGKINMKRIPGNPFSIMALDKFVPVSARFKIKVEGTKINIQVLEGNLNGQSFSDDLITMFHNWLNPLWDFNAFAFPIGIDEYQITSHGLIIKGYVF